MLKKKWNELSMRLSNLFLKNQNEMSTLARTRKWIRWYYKNLMRKNARQTSCSRFWKNSNKYRKIRKKKMFVVRIDIYWHENLNWFWWMNEALNCSEQDCWSDYINVLITIKSLMIWRWMQAQKFNFVLNVVQSKLMIFRAHSNFDKRLFTWFFQTCDEISW